MQPLRYLTILILLLVLLIDSRAAFIPLNPNKLQSGDLIFQTSTPGVIMTATQSIYSHMDIIKRIGNQVTVIEAKTPVKEIPLDA